MTTTAPQDEQAEAVPVVRSHELALVVNHAINWDLALTRHEQTGSPATHADVHRTEADLRAAVRAYGDVLGVTRAGGVQ